MTDDEDSSRPAPEGALARYDEMLRTGEPIMVLFGDFAATVGVSEAAQMVLDLPAMGSPDGRAAIVRVVLEPALIERLERALEAMKRIRDERRIEDASPTPQ